MPFIPQSKLANPCQSVKTLPFGFGFAGGQQKLHQHQASPSPKDMQDLIHLSGPLTEHAVMRTLQARFNEQRYFVSIGGNRLFKSPNTPQITRNRSQNRHSARSPRFSSNYSDSLSLKANPVCTRP